jgi:cell wall-associated NlpC family hydrolase
VSSDVAPSPPVARVPALRPAHLRTGGAPAYLRALHPDPPTPRQRRTLTLAAGTVFAVTALVLIAVVAATIAVVGSASANGPSLATLYTQRIVAGSTAPTAVPAQPVTRPASTVVQRIGGWTPQIGVAIANRALRWLNWPYSFAGGNADGPTHGVPVDHDSRNDGHVIGFDCSGLVLYAMAPWRQLHHFAAQQYLEAGTVHPALDQLLPGDLVFWSKDGTVGGIGHVAVYVGNGNVVQAPRSGARIVITPLGQVEPGAIGTTRPLS